MTRLFIHLYRFFQKRPKLFWSVFALSILLLGGIASRIRLEEDITRFFPDDKRVEKLDYVFKNSRFAEQLVVMVSARDSSAAPEPDSLVALAEVLSAQIEQELKPYLRHMQVQVDDSRIGEFMQTIRDYLPIFLDSADYRALDSMTGPAVADGILEDHYRQLLSPAGMVSKQIIAQDPLGFSFLVLRKLQQLQFDENFELYDNYILSKDQRNLVFFLYPKAAANQTGANTGLIQGLDRILEQSQGYSKISEASYFGAPAVAVGNARQLRSDTILTLSLMTLLLGVILVGYFRKKRAPLLIFIPVLSGALFSLACICLLKGSISVLAVAAGSVILGIAVNYSLHFLAHLKHEPDMEQVIRDLVPPMTVGSLTTVLAFFCLQFVNAAVLRDLGLFAALSLIGAVLSSLIFLPHFLSPGIFKDVHSGEPHDSKWPLEKWLSSHWLLLFIVLLTPVFLYFAGGVRFNNDLGELNFMQPALAQAQHKLESINRATLSTSFIVSTGTDLEEALRHNEQAEPLLARLKAEGEIDKYASVSSFLISDSMQAVRLARWQNFWTPGRKARLSAQVRSTGARLHFSPALLNNFDSLINRTYPKAGAAVLAPFREVFFDNYIIEKEGRATVISLAQIPPARKAAVYAQLQQTPAEGFDRQMLTNLFVQYVQEDFNFILFCTSLLVFCALLLSYGRLELTLITFTPMLITWIWILGIMALLGIEFNIVNVMISTFIFGLGDDYSIFTMDGLQQEYKTGRKNLSSIRSSILLSALTTICGLGVLIFAQHPALRSIAAISIIGIACVFIMSQTIEPFLFRQLAGKRKEKGFAPWTLKGLFWTAFTYGFFVSGSFLLTAIGLVLRLIPFGRKQVKYAFHCIIRGYTWLLLKIGLNIRIDVRGKQPGTFERPGIIISNHSSFMDILLTIMLHPRLILMTNKWVWNSPVFGGVVRLADYYPAMEGAEDSTRPLGEKLQEGYSVVIFPEGTRSVDGRIGRFHKGAFYLAESLQVPIKPLLIHGADDVIKKGDLLLNDGHITLEFLPEIEPEDTRFGETYSARAREVGRYFRAEHARLKRQQETPAYFRKKLISNYIYKGPVLEWYTRIKLRLENNYAPFHELIPRQARILDLGCGYGFLAYMLHFLSEERQITGVDYDAEKIATAAHGYSRTKALQFYCGDICDFDLQGYEVIILADVLHYLPQAQQDALVEKCFAALPPGGLLIIRDGDSDLGDRHRGTRLSELFSIRLLGFNKSTTELQFISGQRLQQQAGRRGYSLERVDETKFTSNVIFVLRSGGAPHPGQAE